MATIGEIMAAKGQKFPKIDDTFEETPETRAPTDDEIEQAPTPIDMPSVSASKTASAPPMDTGEGDIRDLQSAQEAANREANAKVNWRRMTALASLGRLNPDQIDTRDIEASRQIPLQMYQARQAAKKQAAESALQAAHARYFGAETEEIPKREARERKKLDSDIQQAQDTLEETRRGHDLTAQAEAERNLTTLTAERERQQGEMARYSPYETTTRPNPITGELETIQTNRHTGETRVVGGNQSPLPHAVLERYQAKHAGIDKQLDTSDQAQDELAAAEQQVRAHPESFDSMGARAGELGSGLVPLVGPAIAQRLGPALRGDEGQRARVLALQAAATRIHEIAGTRGFSQTERAAMASLVPNENDDSATVIRKLQQAEEMVKRNSDRLRSSLPVNNPPGGGGVAAPAVPDMQDPRTGKTMAWDGSKWAPK